MKYQDDYRHCSVVTATECVGCALYTLISNSPLSASSVDNSKFDFVAALISNSPSSATSVGSSRFSSVGAHISNSPSAVHNSRSRGNKTFSMLNSGEHEILNAHNYRNIKKFSIF